MRDQHVRDVLHLKLALSVAPTGIGGVQPFKWFAEHMHALMVSGDSAQRSASGHRKIRIADMTAIEPDTRFVTLLLHINDINAPDAMFCDIDTDDHRSEAKKPNEGRPETVHLMIDCESSNNIYMGLLEVGDRLNRGQVERYLNRLLRKIRKNNKDAFTYNHPDGAIINGKPHRASVKPRIELNGHLSEEFLEEIKKGKLSGISLVSWSEKHIGTGETKLIKPIHSELRLSPVTSWQDDKVGCITDAMKMAKKREYAAVKVMFKSEDGSPHTCEIDAQTGSARNDGFIKRSRINRRDLMLGEAEEKINSELESEIKSCFNK